MICGLLLGKPIQDDPEKPAFIVKVGGWEHAIAGIVTGQQV
jgi:hypothetical protein